MTFLFQCIGYVKRNLVTKITKCQSNRSVTSILNWMSDGSEVSLLFNCSPLNMQLVQYIIFSIQRFLRPISPFKHKWKVNDYFSYLEEGLDFAPECDLPLGHALGHLAWVPVDPGDQSVAERLVGGAWNNLNFINWWSVFLQSEHFTLLTAMLHWLTDKHKFLIVVNWQVLIQWYSKILPMI
jgi:hypothetical protein